MVGCGLAYRNPRGYTCQVTRRRFMQLCRPFSLRLSQDLLQWLDSWRADRMSRGTAIRVLLEEAMRREREPK